MGLRSYFLRKFNSLKIYREMYEQDSAYVLAILLKGVSTRMALLRNLRSGDISLRTPFKSLIDIFVYFFKYNI